MTGRRLGWLSLGMGAMGTLLVGCPTQSEHHRRAVEHSGAEMCRRYGDGPRGLLGICVQRVEDEEAKTIGR